MIYVYGNSHANFFTNILPATEGISENSKFKCLCKRPMSAENFLTIHYPNLINFISTSNKETDFVLITVGEHDCRMELPQKINESPTEWKNILHRYIDDFFPVILKLKAEGYRPIVWSGHPSSNLILSMEWNNYICELARKNNMEYFVSIMLECIVAGHNTINPHYYMKNDTCHLNSETFLSIVEDKFKSYKLL